MGIKVELLAKLTFAIMATYFFYRFIGPIVFEFFNKTFLKKDKKKSLDEMIREKELLFRKTNQSHGEGSPFSSTKKDDSLSINDLVIEYKKRSNDEKNEEYSSLVELYESLQWGSSDTAKIIVQEGKEKIGLEIEEGFIYQTMKKQFQRSFFQQIPNREKISHYIISSFVIQKLVNKEEAKKIAVPLSNNYLILTEDNLIKGAHILLLKNDLQKDFSEQNFVTILEKPSPIYQKKQDSLDKTIQNTLFSLGRDHIISPDVLVDRIISEALIVCAVSPIQIPDSPTEEQAMELFHIKNKNSLNSTTLKKIYKKFANTCHPDKISGIKMPKEYSETAQANFIKIKNAYDILMKAVKN